MNVSNALKPHLIRPEHLEPHWRWDRAIPSHGHMSVDFERRIDFDRLRHYRLARARQALKNSPCGALLLFDVNNIRYVSGTKIGEWERDKLCRFALLAGDGEPIVWDFGSAAVHHRINCDWLVPDNCRAGMLGMRGTVPPAVGLMKAHAEEVMSLLRAAGVADMPVGVDIAETAMFFELQKAGMKVVDGQQVMLDAREIKNIDEIMLLNQAAAMVDGVYHSIYEALKPGVRENDIVALANKILYEMGSDDVEAINAISGERCNPHPHNFTDRILRPGDQAFFDILQSYQGYRTCYYRTFNIGRATPVQHDAYKQCREWLDDAIALIKPGVSTDTVAKRLAEGGGVRLPQRDGGVRPAVRPWPRARAARAPDHLAAGVAGKSDGDQDRHGVRAGDLLPGERRLLGGPHRGGGRRHRQGLPGDHAVPGGRTADRQPVLRRRDVETVILRAHFASEAIHRPLHASRGLLRDAREDARLLSDDGLRHVHDQTGEEHDKTFPRLDRHGTHGLSDGRAAAEGRPFGCDLEPDPRQGRAAGEDRAARSSIARTSLPARTSCSRWCRRARISSRSISATTASSQRLRPAPENPGRLLLDRGRAVGGDPRAAEAAGLRIRQLPGQRQRQDRQGRQALHGRLRPEGGVRRRCSRIWLTIAASGVSYVGEGELSRICKIAHNVFLGVVIQNLAEITILAQKAGVPRHAFLNFMNASVLGSTFTKYKSNALVNLDWTTTFTPALLRKDLDLGLQAARDLDVAMPVTAATREALQSHFGAATLKDDPSAYLEKDFAALLETVALAAGLKLSPENVPMPTGLRPRG